MFLPAYKTEAYMAIENTRLRYSSKYDVYVDVDTMVIYKRCSRNRKTEITDSELVPLRLWIKYNGYIMFHDSLTNHSHGVYYIYADTFPELVQHSEMHELDPDTYCELDHVNHVHDTIESNYPQNLRWVSPRINRADTSRRVITPADEKHLATLVRRRQRYQERKQDPEWLANSRKKDAERKRRYYYERKDAMLAKQEAVNAEMQRRAGLR